MAVEITAFFIGENMTVPVSDRLSQLYVGNGTNIRFDFTFRVFQQEDETGIAVRQKGVTEFDTIDPSTYSVSVNQDGMGGFITFNTAPAIGNYFYIAGLTVLDQLLDITNYDNFYPDALERALDKLTALLQERSTEIDLEKQARILADIHYDALAMEREADLENRLISYINAMIGITNPAIFDGISDRMIITQDGRTQREFNESIPFWTGDYVNFKQETYLREEQILDHVVAEDEALDSKINNESSRAQAAEDSLLIQLNAVGVGNKAYKTYALMDADKTNIPAKSKVTVTNDATESNNGDWQWDGAAFTKSAYDPFIQAKRALVNPFASYVDLSNSNLANYTYAVVVNDSDPTKNGWYQKSVNGDWVFLRYNTPLQLKDYLSKNGFAQVVLLSDVNANYTTADTTLTITGTGYVATSNGNYVLDTPISLVFPSNAPYRLEFSETTKKLRVTHAGSDREAGWLLCGNIRKDFSGLATDIFKNIRVNGAAPSTSAKANYSLMLTKASTLNFDFNNNKIVVSGNLWIQYEGGRIQVAAQEIALDPARNKGFAQILLVNPTDSTMYVKSQAAPYAVPKDHLQVGAYFENDQIFFGLDHFSVNGKPFQQAASVRPSFGWSFNNQVAVNVIDSFTETDPLYMANLTTSVVYGWFDQLVTDFPDYVTKTTLGNDATGTLPIHQYRFKPKLPNPQNAGLNTKIPKVMLLTIHNEGMNMVALHVLMREICRSWQNSESLESMRHGLEFVVIPVGNPWGLNNGKRTNSNQIDINRQFPADWVQLGVPGDYFYSGTAALSEAEAQHLYAAMVAEKPDVYFDVHSYGSWNNEGTSAWIPILNDKTNSAVISAMTKIYAQYKKKYPWIVDINILFDVSNEKSLGGGTSSKSAATVGAVGGTFESSWNLKNSPDGEPRGHTPAINFSTDLLATCILQSIGVVISSK